jgi:hypothetical protein
VDPGTAAPDGKSVASDGTEKGRSCRKKKYGGSVNRGFPFGRAKIWRTVGSVAGILVLVGGALTFALLSTGRLSNLFGLSEARHPVVPATQSPDVSGPPRPGVTSPHPGGGGDLQGLLEGRASGVLTAVDLSAAGKLDWVHWGYLESDDTSPDRQFYGNPVQVDCQPASRCLNRKQGGSPRIGDFTPVGDVDVTTPFRLYGRDGTRISWSNGAPVRRVVDARTVFYVAHAGNGYRIRVPADQTVHVFTLYLSLWNAKVQCVASLSDRSASDYTDDSLTPDYPRGRNNSYTFTYRAAHPGQTLTVTITIVEDHGGANAAVSAAALS